MSRRPVLLMVVAASLLAAALTVPAVAHPAKPAGRAAPAPLVADAGDSAFVQAGEVVTLLGNGYGGAGGYSYAWTADAGTLRIGDQPAAALDTTKVEPGRHTVTLAVRDSSGRKATDTVTVVVAEAAGERTELASQTVADPTPGTFATGSSREFPLVVPAGLSSLRVALKWANPANDYDLVLRDPTGEEAASSGNAPPDFEEAEVASPVGGTWTVLATRWATTGDPALTMTASVTTVAGGDPRPVVDAGGPYRFVDGAKQQLAATLTGGTGRVTAGWDLDQDGVTDLSGTTVRPSLPAGRHLVTFRAKDSTGLERQRTTSVFVGTAEQVREQQVPITVIGIADSGINPYHAEFSAGAYPDPEVLELTRNFTRHPSEYLPGYPKDARALPVSTDAGYLPERDEFLFDGNRVISPGQLYWIPGTKIIGAYDAGGSTGATSGADTHPILDDNGHGTGSSSVSAGNRYGYCPTCLLVHVEALDESVVAGFDWVDISSNSFGYIGGLPIGPLVGDDVTKKAAERGQTTLFAAGNGVGNAFDVPIVTYGSDQTGPDWNVTVGALRRDNQGAIVGDGIPADVSAWGDGNLPSACRTTIVGQCAFGGTSAATPYTAGVFGSVLTEVRDRLGDGAPGQKGKQVVAQGAAVGGSTFLADGKLTREELRGVVLKTTQALEEPGAQSRFPFPATYTGTQSRYAFEGYGAATPNSATRALAVLLGEQGLPDRSEEDAFFREVCEQRYDVYGDFDRDGDGKPDACSTGYTTDERFDGTGEPTTAPAAPGLTAYDRNRARFVQPAPTEGFTYQLHRTSELGGAKPGAGADGPCAASDSEYMTRTDATGDREPCYGSRITSVAAAYRPIGIWAAADMLDAPLPAGSKVTATVYLATEQAAAEVTGVLVATDREIGRGSGGLQPTRPTADAAVCEALGEQCWTKFEMTFTTDRPAVAGEQLTFQAEHLGVRTWAYGYEGAHASQLTVTPAKLPRTGLEFGATIDQLTGGTRGRPVVAGGAVAFPDLGADPQAAGFHPSVEHVQVSVGDPTFARPVHAMLDAATGSWSVQLPDVGVGSRVYVRAVRDGLPSPAGSRILKRR
ncbi:MAG: S8 family serine peptidase [Mycobacteriales bacterium]